MFHFGLNNKKLKLNNHSVGEGLVIDRDCWDGEEDTEGVLFRILIRGDDDEVVVILGRDGIDDVVVILGRDGDDVILGRGGVDEVVAILGRGVDDVVVILGRGGVDEVVVILSRGGVDEFLSVEGVEGVWPIEAKISAGTKSLKGSE
ncbi:hypothetical protein C1645_812790, partial [Glomus cerebriforme]